MLVIKRKKDYMKSQDYLVFLIYFLLVAGYGLYIYRKKVC